MVLAGFQMEKLCINYLDNRNASLTVFVHGQLLTLGRLTQRTFGEPHLLHGLCIVALSRLHFQPQAVAHLYTPFAGNIYLIAPHVLRAAAFAPLEDGNAELGIDGIIGIEVGTEVIAGRRVAAVHAMESVGK